MSDKPQVTIAQLGEERLDRLETTTKFKPSRERVKKPRTLEELDAIPNEGEDQ